MRWQLLVLALFAFAGLAHSEEDCHDVSWKFNQCTRKAFRIYSEAMMRGEEGDGREHYRARKTCNYLTSSIEECGDLLMENECHTEEEVTNMKDTQLAKALERIGKALLDFDGRKCPPVRAHLRRMRRKEHLEALESISDRPSCTRGNDYDYDGIPGNLDFDLDGVVDSDDYDDDDDGVEDYYDDDDDNDGIPDDEDDDDDNDGVPDLEEGLPPCPRTGIPWRRLRESGSSLLVSLLALPPLVLHLAGY